MDTGINASNDHEDIVDLSNIRFIFPLFALAFSCIKEHYGNVSKNATFSRPNKI